MGIAVVSLLVLQHETASFRVPESLLSVCQLYDISLYFAGSARVEYSFVYSYFVHFRAHKLALVSGVN